MRTSSLFGQTLRSAAEAIYAQCAGAGLEVLYDDRGLRAGAQLADADLIGAPLRLVIGKRIAQGEIELVERRTGLAHVLGADGAAEALQRLLGDLLQPPSR
jgi:prolyl-tRNA synthetase